MNDSAYATEIIDSLVAMTEALFTAMQPEEDPMRLDLALDPQELADLAEALRVDVSPPAQQGKTDEDKQAAR